jgi:hypothetical protein
MLICATCHRNNAPWAKQCTSCKSSLLESPQRLTTAPPPETVSEPVTVIQTWDPQAPVPASSSLAPTTEWRETEEIVSSIDLDDATNFINTGKSSLFGSKVEKVAAMSASSLSPPTVGRFDSQPIASGSKDRFEDYGYDFEEKENSPWLKRGLLLAGVLGILMAGGLAIKYIHSTAPLLASVPAIFKKPAKSDISNAATNNDAATGDRTMLLKSGGEQPNQQFSRPSEQELVGTTPPTIATTRSAVIAATEPVTAMNPSGANKATEPKGPAVFVMSASEPVSAKPPAGKIEVATQPLAAKPVKTISSLVVPPKPSKPIAPKVDPKQGPYPVLVPVPTVDAKTTTAMASSSDFSAKASAADAAKDQSVAAQSSARLQNQQSNDCSNSAFLGKVFCEERTRVNFCRNRWNEHPDCQLGSKIDP